MLCSVLANVVPGLLLLALVYVFARRHPGAGNQDTSTRVPAPQKMRSMESVPCQVGISRMGWSSAR